MRHAHIYLHSQPFLFQRLPPKHFCHFTATKVRSRGGVSGYTQETRDTPYVLIVFLIVSFLRVVNILSFLRHYIVFQEKRKNSRPLWYPKSKCFCHKIGCPKFCLFSRTNGGILVASMWLQPFFLQKAPRFDFQEWV